MARFFKFGRICFCFIHSPACLEVKIYTFQPQDTWNIFGSPCNTGPVCTSYLSYTSCTLIFDYGENDDDSGSFLDWMNSSFKTHLLPCCRNLLSYTREVVGKFGTLSQGILIFDYGENDDDSALVEVSWTGWTPHLKPIYSPVVGIYSPVQGK